MQISETYTTDLFGKRDAITAKFISLKAASSI